MQEATDTASAGPTTWSLAAFVEEFGTGLLDAVRTQNPPVYDGTPNAYRSAVMNGLLRKPFAAQSEVVQSVTRLLVDHEAPAAVINAEMGTGKTMMAIATAACLHAEGLRRALVVCPPHLVYKWRREILETVPAARVCILNGPDTLRKLLQLRGVPGKPSAPEFYVMGRVRMRMGFNWTPAVNRRRWIERDDRGRWRPDWACCANCGTVISDLGNGDGESPLSYAAALVKLNERQSRCDKCGSPLWTLTRRSKTEKPRADAILDSIKQLPTIGDKTARRLMDRFGSDMLGAMLEDNVYEFINLMDEEGDLFFSDRQAKRMERALATTEFSFGQGGYQATEFIKRYLPQGFFGLLVADEGHEFKNDGSAQGQAFGVLARKCSKSLLLTGTLMGGYADDLFYLLWRLNPKSMIDDGYLYNQRGSLGSASMDFMREHGVLKDIYRTSEGDERSHRTAKGRVTTHRTAKAPGFGPQGVMHYVLPMTVFLKLKEIGGAVLPPYEEHFDGVAMSDVQDAAYRRLESTLKSELRVALRKGDKSLLGVVLNALLAFPDCCFRLERVQHPHSRAVLAFEPAVFGDVEPMPKELRLLEICNAEKKAGRRVLVYSVYSGTRDTTARLKALLEREGLKTAVLRSSVDASQREDWLFEQVERGVDVIVTNPDLVKTGLDMLEFPTIVFMTTGFNVYTLQQASRRSWRIGQSRDVHVHFLGYAGSAQMACLELMGKKIAVSQSTSGDVPESGLDVLNQFGRFD